MTPRHTFIVRIWEEPSQKQSGAWRGSVEIAGTEERRYFVDLADLQAFIRDALARQSGRNEQSAGFE